MLKKKSTMTSDKRFLDDYKVPPRDREGREESPANCAPSETTIMRKNNNNARYPSSIKEEEDTKKFQDYSKMVKTEGELRKR